MITYPPAGETWIFDIGEARIEHRYESDRRMRYRILTGEFAGAEESVAIAVTPVAAAQFLVSWQEGDRTTVVHWEDFASGTFESFVTLPDLRFQRFRGRMSKVA